MKNSSAFEIGKQFVRKTLSNRGLFALLFVFYVLLVVSAVNGWKAYAMHHESTHHHQEVDRESWESNPDKHPHRMAHYGSFVFREQHPLSIFDSGIENYTGNAIFLEAHRQNSANFSQASLSTGLVRIGDLNIGMLLQFVLPLIIFFIGFGSMSIDRKDGILKIMYIQGVSIKEILFGKVMGLFAITALFFLPALLILWSIPLFASTDSTAADMIPRVAFLSIGYVIYLLILCLITVLVSMKSSSSTTSLLVLLGGWLILCVILPKSAQVVGNYIYPNLSKMEFTEAVDAEVSKRGDSHNPDDPYFQALKDSILQEYNVTNTKDLPINYGGFIMAKGEEQTSIIYGEEKKKLIQSYRSQNGMSHVIALINPFMAIKNISRGFSSTDFETYVHFLNQVETYRYDQSQYLNELQMKFISNAATSSEGKVNVISKDYWTALPAFDYQYHSMIAVMKSQCHLMLSLFIWLAICVVILIRSNNPTNLL